MNPAPFDLKDVCRKCGSWCCQEDAPYMSDEEQRDIGAKFERLGRCPFLSDDGSCAAYDRRPFECRVFPFTLKMADDGSPIWCVWDVCPGVKSMDLEASLDAVESSLAPSYSASYVKAYLEKEEFAWDRYDRMGLSPRPLRKARVPGWTGSR